MAIHKATSAAPTAARQTAPRTTPGSPAVATAELELPLDEGAAYKPSVWAEAGTRHNVALAECAAVENRCPDTITGHHVNLTYAYMYHLALEDLNRDLNNSKRESHPNFYINLFAARVFYAGICAGRAEAGQRGEDGELLHDSPHRAEEGLSPLNPARVGGVL